ncbi:MAG: carboxypeptidase M32 [Bacteroidetes bacterium]|nr:carboxypeptidase M32 [Bacteroidota bacterium]
MKDRQKSYEQYQSISQKAADLNYAAAVLGWDQETYMPPKGFEARGRQIATLSTQAHALLTSDTYKQLLLELAGSEGLDEAQVANVQLSLEDFEKAARLPEAFVEELAQAGSTAFQAWIAARRANDYQLFAPHLAHMITLKKKQAAYYSFEVHPYDALLDEYEKGATVAQLDPLFESIRQELSPLLQAIATKTQVQDEFFYRQFDKDKQWQFSLEVLRKMGFDFEAGRQDYSEHPFTTSFAPGDVRITTRVQEQNLAALLWSSIHEGGHALYEQGLPESEYGLPLGAAASLSIHESQSRLWENCVGRGLPFWAHFYPRLQLQFPDQLNDISLQQFYRGMNKVEPSLIRTEADELSYHFHVMIRYELEKALLDGSLNPEDLRDAWNAKYELLLGIRPPNDVQGILQDVHWCHGSFGYFPTYTLGSFYAAQFWQQAVQELPDLNKKISAGELIFLKDWLREKVHVQGRRYRSEALCKKITGRGLDFNAFLHYAKQKYAVIYEEGAQ